MKDRLLGRVIADRYRLENRLGVGGMGSVYRARHLLIDRVVAIKILSPDRRGEEHFRAWFLREARAVNRINHANIVDINDFGETEDGLAYLVMEILIGESLSSQIARGPMDISVAVDILEQNTAALARAHDLGVIHRDIKPDNIFLINRGGRKNFVKLLDFGLARLSRDGRLAAKGAVFGTPEYMTPEQARGEDAIPVSDLYSLGIIFYEMMTGRLPYNATNRDGYIESHKKIIPSPPSKYNPDIDPHAEKIIVKLLEKDPTKRFRDAHHLLDEFKSLQRRVGQTKVWESSDMNGTPSSVVSPVSSMDYIARWALKATIFGRMVSRMYTDEKAPDEITKSLNNLWKLTADSARVDGEYQIEAKRSEKLEKRGKEFRAQVGRRVEDLSREQSRLKREIASANSELLRLKEDYRQAGLELMQARNIIASVDKGRDEMTSDLRKAYETAGAAAARRQARAEAVAKVEAKINKWGDESDRIDSQVSEYKEQLDRQSSSIEENTESARKNLVSKMSQRDEHFKALEREADFLKTHFAKKAECMTLLNELMEFDVPDNQKTE